MWVPQIVLSCTRNVTNPLLQEVRRWTFQNEVHECACVCERVSARVAVVEGMLGQHTTATLVKIVKEERKSVKTLLRLRGELLLLTEYLSYNV